MIRAARYTVTPTEYGCELRLRGDYGRDHEDSRHEFWVGAAGGYVHETTRAPGTSGRQVCETLFGLGSTLWCCPDSLVSAIRKLARKHCDIIDREAA